jgi:hypothetical protein
LYMKSLRGRTGQPGRHSHFFIEGVRKIRERSVLIETFTASCVCSQTPNKAFLNALIHLARDRLCRRAPNRLA